MCKSKTQGGRRCYGHANKRFTKAVDMYTKFNASHPDNHTPSMVKQRTALAAAVYTAAVNLASTKRGQEALEKEHTAAAGSKNEQWYQNVLRDGDRKRAAVTEEAKRERNLSLATETNTPIAVINSIDKRLRANVPPPREQEARKHLKATIVTLKTLPASYDLTQEETIARAVAVTTGTPQTVKRYPHINKGKGSGDGFIFNPDGEYRWGIYGAAGILVRNKNPETGEEKFFLAKRGAAVSGGAGTWALPGGGLDVNENPQEGALREFEEELGTPVNNPVPRGGHENTNFPGWTYSTICVDTDTETNIAETSVDWETTERGWFTKEQIEKMNLFPAVKANLNSLFSQFDN